MKTRAQYTRTLSPQVVGNYFHLVREENLRCYKSTMYFPEALISLSADQSRLSTNDRLTYSFKARLISSPAVQWQAARSHPKPSLTQLKASQVRLHCRARKDHQGNESSLYLKYPPYPRYLHASTRRMNLHQLSSETSPTVPFCPRNRSSVSCQTKKCSFRPQRRHHHKGRLSQSEVRTHRIGQLHRRQR